MCARERSQNSEGFDEKARFDARVKSLVSDVPNLPNFTRFHDAFRDNPKRLNEGDMRTPSTWPTTRRTATHVKLNSKEIDDLAEEGPELVSAKFVIPYPPGFPIMVPGQVITKEIIEFMRKLNERDPRLHAASGLELLKPEQLGGAKQTAGSRLIRA